MGGVSVIIPTLNEDEWLADAIDSAFAAGAAEVLVADAASVDRTPRIAKAHGARLLLTERPRARQLNAAVQAAAHDQLIVLHADSRLPPRPLHGEHLVERAARRGGDAVQEQPDLRLTHARGATSDENVRVHLR